MMACSPEDAALGGKPLKPETFLICLTAEKDWLMEGSGDESVRRSRAHLTVAKPGIRTEALGENSIRSSFLKGGKQGSGTDRSYT
jgi:hypothetical protein